MSARILVVDDILANVKILEAKLSAEYYIVLTATSGQQAIDIILRDKPDLVLLDVMMPGMDGFEVCSKIKSIPEVSHIPVVMVTALDQPSDRIRGIEAGADDFLTKPANDLALFARVRSLVRVKMMIDELKLRDDTCRDLGIEDTSLKDTNSDMLGKLVIVDSSLHNAQKLGTFLSEKLNVHCDYPTDRETTLKAAATSETDVFVIDQHFSQYDGLRLCSEIRSIPQARNSTIILVAEHADYKAIAAGLDLGANDYIMRPIDRNEMLARVRSQLKRKAYADRLRTNVQKSLMMAVTDPLTGLYNRRYCNSHLQSLLKKGRENGSNLSLMLMDLDKFKSVNDTYGHDVGDEVLKEFARRLRENMRGIDLVARYGGEEFIAILPETEKQHAFAAAERLRKSIEAPNFSISHSAGELQVTVSIGLVGTTDCNISPDALIKFADQALYASKNDGRNRVTFAYAA